MADRRFRAAFDNALKSVALTEEARRQTIDAAFGQRKLGHPEFEKLAILERKKSKSTVLFLDIRGFTKLSFSRENEELLGIIQAVTLASVEEIADNGGYVGEFTGDGVMAYFGDSRTSDEDAAYAALRTAGGLMEDVKDYVNPRLSRNGGDPIRIALGMEHGQVLWSRIGTPGTSQVKAVSDVTFLAGKLATSKFTNAWECKIGERLAAWLDNDFKEKTEAYKFQIDGRQFSHDLYLFDWLKFNQEEARRPSLKEAFKRRRIDAPLLSSATAVVTPGPVAPGPRPLKDQPFF